MEITSSLYKILQLTQASAYFPAMVRAAAAVEGRPYSDELLVWVASRPEVTGSIKITVTDGVPSSVDTVLEQLLTTDGAAVDSVIVAAVNSYTPA